MAKVIDDTPLSCVACRDPLPHGSLPGDLCRMHHDDLAGLVEKKHSDKRPPITPPYYDINTHRVHIFIHGLQHAALSIPILENKRLGYSLDEIRNMQVLSAYELLASYAKDRYEEVVPLEDDSIAYWLGFSPVVFKNLIRPYTPEGKVPSYYSVYSIIIQMKRILESTEQWD